MAAFASTSVDISQAYQPDTRSAILVSVWAPSSQPYCKRLANCCCG